MILQRLEEERKAHMADYDESDEDYADDNDVSDTESHLTESFVSSRPMSGKEARQARSARIRAAHQGKKPLDANRKIIQGAP